MGSRPIPLSNIGAKCYLNTCIQAISACDIFIKKIQDLTTEYCNLEKLNLFYSLMNIMNGNSHRQDISQSLVFRTWNKPGQQDSYELLSHIINEIYQEIKVDKESNKSIDKGDITQWLETNLPLRIKMENEINCKCGLKDKTPLQTDIALHLSFPPNDKVTLHLDKLLEDYFHEEIIHDFKCGEKNCSLKDATKKVTLCTPSPDTICVHLQRLRLEGKQMRKIDAKVLFCNRLTLKGKYVKDSYYVEESEDVHYYLKSVIVHFGGASSGHYACFKRSGSRWFYADDSLIKDSSIEGVFSCNPYILFYERSQYDIISPTMIKIDKNLNIFIHSIISCSAFNDWLHLIAQENDIMSITLLAYLSDFANGNVTFNEGLERDVKNYWCSKKDVYETMLTVFGGVARFADGPKEKWFKDNVPLGSLVISTFKCHCGYSAPSPPQLYRSIDISVSASASNLQALFDEFCDEPTNCRDMCSNKTCSNNKGFNCQRLSRPLPKMMCILLKHHNRSSSVKIFNKLIVTKKHCTESCASKSDSDATYMLRSVIPNGGNICYRKINDQWLSINESFVKYVSYKEVLSVNPYMLFFQLEEIERPVLKNERRNPEPAPDNDSRRRISDVNHPLTRNLGFFDLFNNILHSLSSCSAFIDWLSIVKSKGSPLSKVRSLTRIIKMSTGMIPDDDDFDVASIDNWNYIFSTNGFISIRTLMNDMLEEVKAIDSTNEVCLPLIMMNLTDKEVPIDRDSINIALSSSSYNPKKPIQQILSDGLEFYSNTESSIIMLLAKQSPNTILFKGYLPRTICVNNLHNYSGILTSLELVLHNELCSKRGCLGQRNPETIDSRTECLLNGKCCRKYSLRSMISKNNHCFKISNNQWYKLSEYSSNVCSESDLGNVEPMMLFYE